MVMIYLKVISEKMSDKYVLGARKLLRRCLLITLTAAVLTGCSGTQLSFGSNRQVSLKAGGVYQGYPCGEDCSGFKEGYDGALHEGIKKSSLCDDFVQIQQLGCKAYVTDYDYEHKTFNELLKDF
jgi:hypothetical protein